MHRRDHRQRAFGPELVDQLEDPLALADVERGRRLIEEEQRRSLRERSGEDDPLQLAAGTFVETPIGEIVQRETLRGRATPPPGRSRARGEASGCAGSVLEGRSQATVIAFGSSGR